MKHTGKFLELIKDVTYSEDLTKLHIRCLFEANKHMRSTALGLELNPSILSPKIRSLLTEISKSLPGVTVCDDLICFDIGAQSCIGRKSFPEIVREIYRKITHEPLVLCGSKWRTVDGNRVLIPGDAKRLNELNRFLSARGFNTEKKREYITYAITEWNNSSIKKHDNLIGFVISLKVFDRFCPDKKFDIGGFVDDRQGRVDEWNGRQR